MSVEQVIAAAVDAERECRASAARLQRRAAQRSGDERLSLLAQISVERVELAALRAQTIPRAEAAEIVAEGTSAAVEVLDQTSGGLLDAADGLAILDRIELAAKVRFAEHRRDIWEVALVDVRELEAGRLQDGTR